MAFPGKIDIFYPENRNQIIFYLYFFTRQLRLYLSITERGQRINRATDHHCENYFLVSVKLLHTTLLTCFTEYTFFGHSELLVVVATLKLLKFKKTYVRASTEHFSDTFGNSSRPFDFYREIGLIKIMNGSF